MSNDDPAQKENFYDLGGLLWKVKAPKEYLMV